MRSLLLLAVVVCLFCLSRAQMDVYADEYQLYAVVDADDIDAYDIQQFGFGGAGFGGNKGLAALPTIIQGGGKHGGLGGGHGKHGGGAFNIIVGVPTPVPTPVPVPVYQPTTTIAHVQHIPREVKGQTAVQVPVTTKQQFQGTTYVQTPEYGKAGAAY